MNTHGAQETKQSKTPGEKIPEKTGGHIRNKKNVKLKGGNQKPALLKGLNMRCGHLAIFLNRSVKITLARVGRLILICKILSLQNDDYRR